MMIPADAKPALFNLLEAAEAAHEQAETLRSYAEALRNALTPGLVSARTECVEYFFQLTCLSTEATQT